MHTTCKHLWKVCHSIVRKMNTDASKGAPMSAIYRDCDPFDLDHLPPVANKRDHIVLYKLPITGCPTRPPKPFKGENKWDQHHVRMPYDPQSKFKSENTVMVKTKNRKLLRTFTQFILSVFLFLG